MGVFRRRSSDLQDLTLLPKPPLSRNNPANAPNKQVQCTVTATTVSPPPSNTPNTNSLRLFPIRQIHIRTTNWQRNPNTHTNPLLPPINQTRRHRHSAPLARYESQRHRSTSSHIAIDARYMSSLFSHPAPSIFQPLIRRISNTSTDSSSGHSTAPPTPNPKLKPAASQLSKTSLSNTYESRTGSHVVLEFADPMPNSQERDSPHGGSTPACRGTMSWSASYHGNPTSNCWGRNSPLSPDTASSVVGGLTTPSQTRLQATFEALKKMGSGLASPRAEVRAPGYFDVVVEGAEA